MNYFKSISETTLRERQHVSTYVFIFLWLISHREAIFLDWQWNFFFSLRRLLTCTQCIFLVAKELIFFIFGEKKTRLRYVAARFVMQNSNLQRLNKILKRARIPHRLSNSLLVISLAEKSEGVPLVELMTSANFSRSRFACYISGHSHIFHFFLFQNKYNRYKSNLPVVMIQNNGKGIRLCFLSVILFSLWNWKHISTHFNQYRD